MILKSDTEILSGSILLDITFINPLIFNICFSILARSPGLSSIVSRILYESII